MSWRPGGDLKGTGPSSEGVPGVAYLPDGKVHDAWGHVPRRIESHWFRDVRTHHFNYHPWARLRAVVDGVYSSEEAARDERRKRQRCSASRCGATADHGSRGATSRDVARPCWPAGAAAAGDARRCWLRSMGSAQRQMARFLRAGRA